MQFVKRYALHPRAYYRFKDLMVVHMQKVKEKHDCQFANMAYSDYKLPFKGINYKPPYWDEASSLINDALLNYANTWGCEDIKIQNMWFAEYETGNNFNWHTHEGCNLSAVLQLHGGHQSATQLYGIEDLKVSAGDFVIFPSMLPHRGPEVTGHKICIGFNLSMGGSLLHNE
jgi:hypothetical protein